MIRHNIMYVQTLPRSYFKDLMDVIWLRLILKSFFQTKQKQSIKTVTKPLKKKLKTRLQKLKLQVFQWQDFLPQISIIRIETWDLSNQKSTKLD